MSSLDYQNMDSTGSAADAPPSGRNEGGVAEVGPKKLSWQHLAFFCFIFTSAGPFGMEAVVREGGRLWAFLMIFVIPVVHVGPMILIVTELSAWMPTNHGSIRWIDRAFGHVVGFVSGTMQLCINFVDLAVYPVMFGTYVTTQFAPNMTHNQQYAMQVAVAVVGSIPAFFGVDDMSVASAVFMALIVLPFGIGVFAGLPQVDTALWGETAEDFNIAATLTVGIWMYTGFMSLGALGGEVKHHSVFLKGCGVAALIDIAMYFFPLMVTAQVQGPWDDGFLVTAFDRVLPGLGIGIGIAGALSGLGLYTSSIACDARTMWGIADKGWLPRIFTRTNERTGSPYVAVIAHVLLTCALVNFDFEFLVSLELVISAANYCLLYCGFIVLRYTEPDAPRPYTIPGGILGAWALITPIVVIYFTLFMANIVDWRISSGVGAFVVLLALLYHFVLDKNVKNVHPHHRDALPMSSDNTGMTDTFSDTVGGRSSEAS